MATVAHMYAQALHDAAQERGRVKQVRKDLGEFAEAAAEVPELRELLRNPQVDPRAKAAALQDLLKTADELVRNFLLLLAEKGRSADLEEIAREFERLVEADEGVVHLELTTALELSDADAQRLVKQIEKASGHPVVATRTVDPELIGGVVIKAGSLLLDGSIRGRLNRLRQTLVRSAT
jgi:F-type H+-transporting ATPase subunit delta